MWTKIKTYIIETCGGFVTVQDALNSIEDEKDKAALLTLTVKRLYNTINADDILQEKEGVWFVKGKAITDGEKKQLIDEARMLQNMRLWSVLCDDVKYQANRRMFLEAENDLQLTAGKLWTFTLDAFETRIRSLVKGSGFFNK